MAPPASVDRLRRVFRDKTGGSSDQALFALLLAVITVGAYVARVGSQWARAATALSILGVLSWQVVLFVRASRGWKSTRVTLQRVLYATDSAVASRAMRALALTERAETDDSVGSHELAELHLARILDRVSNDAVRIVASRRAQRTRGIAITLLSCAVLAVFLDPARVIEGLDVLVARGGRAPLTMTWLKYSRVSAQPPSYTREAEHSLVFGTSVAVPKGTVITIRGVPRVPGRDLVVTDGAVAVAFASDGSGGLVARYTVRSTVSLRVAARFGDVRIDDEDALDVTMIPDARPRVELEGAPRTVKLIDVEEVTVRWAAYDDHGLREVDLVLRSGAREDRRVLGRFDGEDKVERGGTVLPVRDVFLRRVFLPVTVTVEAKDNDPLDGPKWSASAPLTIEPPEVGEPEALRYLAIAGLRDEIVALLGSFVAEKNKSLSDLRAENAERVRKLAADADEVLGKSYAGATVARGMKSFVEGQLDRLRANLNASTLADATLAVDVALRSLGNRDAADVAKRLADVAEEAALGARLARETEKKQDGLARLDVALTGVEKGARHLSALAGLGNDLGSVATADSGRIRRAREASDLMHAELAALHLAARLSRPAPSFGATTGRGRKGGVESGSGHGRGEGAGPPPSDADEAFNRASSALDDLAREHESALRSVESALDEASQSEPSEADKKRAKELADRVRQAADPLPLPGQEFGTPSAAASLSREHANAAAQALENMSLKEAKESAENALGSLDQAEQHLDPDDDMRTEFRNLRGALRDALDFANKEIERRRAEAAARAKSTLDQASQAERELAERATQFASGKGDAKLALPHAQAEDLERASSVMKEASGELAAGHGDRGVELQREAQRLLEKSRLGRSNEPDDATQREAKSDRSEPSEHKAGDGDSIALGGDVPGPDDRARAEEFRRRVLKGLGHDRSERLSPAVKRYTEGLLK